MKINELTAREQEVVNLVLQGLTAKEIADSLVISYHTVRTHLINIYEKLGIKGKTALFVHKIKELTNESKQN